MRFNSVRKLQKLNIDFTASITAAGACRAACLNKGICFNGISCYCPEDYIGTKCEVPVCKCPINNMITCSHLKTQDYNDYM